MLVAKGKKRAEKHQRRTAEAHDDQRIDAGTHVAGPHAGRSSVRSEAEVS
jgi:hypothetical protein